MSDTLQSLRQCILDARHASERVRVAALLSELQLDAKVQAQTGEQAIKLVERVRGQATPNLLEAFLAEYGLSTDEGIAMMCLAEALLRVPDSPTIDALIEDKIVPGRWGQHLNHSSSSLVNASTWALMLTGRLLSSTQAHGIVDTLRNAVKRLGEPAVRVIIAEAMKELGRQFVLGRDIEEALERSSVSREKGYTCSYDMLGEAARCEADARRYHLAYSEAVSTLAPGCSGNSVRDNPGISVKLSALHPRFEYAQRQRALDELLGRVAALAQLARSAGMGFNIDAEESERLDLTLDVIEVLLSDQALAGWDGFGVVVQAYSLSASAVIDWLHCLAERQGRRIMVRLVKGAYWDTEIKRAQVLGLNSYPVFTRKASTDVSYLACAQKLLGLRETLYPQFATHNAHTVAAVMALAGAPADSFEFQRLHGMGEALYREASEQGGYRCRIYAPVGAHKDLLAYLVRRLLENGANSSFVNQVMDHQISATEVARDPLDELRPVADCPAHPAIVLPRDLYAPARLNSVGWDLSDRSSVDNLKQQMGPFMRHNWDFAGTAYKDLSGATQTVCNPAWPTEVVGKVCQASPTDLPPAIASALAAAGPWAALQVRDRAQILIRAADLYERHAGELIAIAAREAGKTLADGVAEVREAVDFLRYYASEAAQSDFSQPRGIFACISPWNFPLAIFTGQVSAALVMGNSVIAKPAEQTPLMALRATALLQEAGLPEGVLQCLPGEGSTIGSGLVASDQVGGVCFTGSTDTALHIHRTLAAHGNAAAALIAETGGLNAMLVDSTALPEQAVRDIMVSAFQSAGQRCSALRVLYLQREIKNRVLDMLFGAMDELCLGDPLELTTDVGPLIDEEALNDIEGYCTEQAARGRVLKRLSVPGKGFFAPPTVLEVDGIEEVEREIFGPVLHVAAYRAQDLSQVVGAINQRGYGLTLGLHSRVDARVEQVIDQARVGNVYVNRNQIGAVVGSQPFGGEGLSGTGPKAGGPHYLARFAHRTAPALASPGIVSSIVSAAQINDWAATTDNAEQPLDLVQVDQFLESVAPLLPANVVQVVGAIAANPREMPGPTGESNRLTLYPRGRILCLGPDKENLRLQVCQALALGNRVLAIAAQPDLPTSWHKRWPLVTMSGVISPDSLAKVRLIDAVALHLPAAALRPWREALACRDGPIITLVSEQIAPEGFVIERHVCVDTTASGGNTTLLVQAA